jgi:hypothetical protein
MTYLVESIDGLIALVCVECGGHFQWRREAVTLHELLDEVETHRAVHRQSPSIKYGEHRWGYFA